MKNIGFIGMGNMGKAMAAGFTAWGNVKNDRLFAFAPNLEKLKKNCDELGINPCASLSELAASCDVIFMACKPYQIEDVLKELGDIIKGKSIVSVAAGWDFARYRSVLPAETHIQCIMPNTPVSVAKGVLLVEEENDWEEAERGKLLELLASVGKVVELPSRLMNAGMAVSGCDLPLWIWL